MMLSFFRRSPSPPFILILTRPSIAASHIVMVGAPPVGQEARSHSSKFFLRHQQTLERNWFFLEFSPGSSSEKFSAPFAKITAVSEFRWSEYQVVCCLTISRCPFDLAILLFALSSIARYTSVAKTPTDSIDIYIQPPVIHYLLL